MDKSNWKNIWEKREFQKRNSLLMSLIHTNGYETCEFTEEVFANYINHITNKLGAEPKSSFYEVGSGSGAILHVLNDQDFLVNGCDYSKALVDICKSELNISIDHCEASNILVTPQYDYVISNNVFQYFKHLEYTRTVIIKMMEKSRLGKIAILDNNDLDKKDLYHKIRSSSEENYTDIQHLFTRKTWWMGIALDLGWSCEIEDQCIENYKNNDFKFNVYLTRKV